MTSAFLNIRSRHEGILPYLCNFYTACTECKSCYRLKDSLKVFGEDFRFDSIVYAFSAFGPR